MQYSDLNKFSALNLNDDSLSLLCIYVFVFFYPFHCHLHHSYCNTYVTFIHNNTHMDKYIITINMVDDSFVKGKAQKLKLFVLLHPYWGENNLICLLTPFLISLWFTTKLMRFSIRLTLYLLLCLLTESSYMQIKNTLSVKEVQGQSEAAV